MIDNSFDFKTSEQALGKKTPLWAITPGKLGAGESSSLTVVDTFYYTYKDDSENQREISFKFSLYVDPKKVCDYLVKTAFTSGLTGVEYLLLYYCIQKIFHSKKVSTIGLSVYVGIIVLSGEKLQGATTFESKSKKLKRPRFVPSSKVEESEFNKYNRVLDKILRDGAKVARIPFSYETVERPYPKTLEIRRIGVGYKDKGYQSKPHETRESRVRSGYQQEVALTISEVLSICAILWSEFNPKSTE